MRRENFFRLSLSRLAQASTDAVIELVLAGTARADSIKTFFVKSGMARNVWGMDLDSCTAGAFCSFFGTPSTDITVGSISTIAITFPGLLRLNKKARFSGPKPSTPDWISAANHNASDLLDFTTTQTPASLLGFDGGSIIGLSVGNPRTRIPFTPTSAALHRSRDPSHLGCLELWMMGPTLRM